MVLFDQWFIVTRANNLSQPSRKLLRTTFLSHLESLVPITLLLLHDVLNQFATNFITADRVVWPARLPMDLLSNCFPAERFTRAWCSKWNHEGHLLEVDLGWRLRSSLRLLNNIWLESGRGDFNSLWPVLYKHFPRRGALLHSRLQRLRLQLSCRLRRLNLASLLFLILRNRLVLLVVEVIVHLLIIWDPIVLNFLNRLFLRLWSLLLLSSLFLLRELGLASVVNFVLLIQDITVEEWALISKRWVLEHLAEVFQEALTESNILLVEEGYVHFTVWVDELKSCFEELVVVLQRAW